MIAMSHEMQKLNFGFMNMNQVDAKYVQDVYHFKLHTVWVLHRTYCQVVFTIA